VQLRGEDFEDTIDFMNLVFGAYAPIDFAQLLPALYQPTDEHMGRNWAVREKGRIRAVVGSFPMQWCLGETTLEVAGIGGVSSHPRARGAGHMRQLMQHCVEHMRTENKHLSWLGGQRQRYGYFGYEKCGSAHNFSLDKTNLRHTYGNETSPIHFRTLQADDRTHIQGAIELHAAQPFRCLRPAESFHALLCSWDHRPHIALAPDGRMIGYLVANQSGDLVSELFAVEEGRPDLEIARAWVEQQGGGSVRLELEPWHRLLPQLAHIAESFSTHATGNWQIFDWVSTLDALMKVRATMGPLVAGEVVVEIEDYGKLALWAEGESARCSTSDKQADLSVDAFTAHRLLCGPLPPSRVVALPTAAAVLEQWCPLPLSWTKQDGV
jgi:GNAT superfamily N-acetyltransferase